MIAFTQQQGQWFCFLACLESFLAEQGILVSQDEIRKKTPDIYGAHPNDLGGFAPHSFPPVVCAAIPDQKEEFLTREPKWPNAHLVG